MSGTAGRGGCREPTPPRQEGNHGAHEPCAVNPAPRCGETLAVGPPCSSRTCVSFFFFCILTRQQQPISFKAIRWCDFITEASFPCTLSGTTINSRRLILAALRCEASPRRAHIRMLIPFPLLMIESGEWLGVYQADKWTAHHSGKIIPVMH